MGKRKWFRKGKGKQISIDRKVERGERGAGEAEVRKNQPAERRKLPISQICTFFLGR